MTFATDIADDFLEVADNLVEVKLRDRCGNTKAIDHCLRRAVSAREAARSNGRFQTSDTVFHLATSEVPLMPALGSKIIDDQGSWTVLSVERQTLSSRWRCVARNLAIAHCLTEIFHLEKATFSKNPNGAQVPTWIRVAEKIKGRVQPMGAEREVKHGLRNAPQLVAVFLEENLVISENHRFVDAAGTIYLVKSWEDQEAIETLFKVNCEVTPWVYG